MTTIGERLDARSNSLLVVRVIRFRTIQDKNDDPGVLDPLDAPANPFGFDDVVGRAKAGSIDQGHRGSSDDGTLLDVISGRAGNGGDNGPLKIK